MLILWYRRAISSVAFCCIIAIIEPLPFLLVFMILMWACAFWWKSALLIGDAMSLSIVLWSGILSYLLNIKHLSAIFDPPIRAGRGHIRTLWILAPGGTVSHQLVGLGVDFGLGSCCGWACSLSCCLGLGWCCSWCPCSSPPSCIESGCFQSSSPPLSILAVLSLSVSGTSWPSASPFMIFPIMFLLHTRHTLSSSWLASNFSYLCCIHVIIPSHCASPCATWPFNNFD